MTSTDHETQLILQLTRTPELLERILLANESELKLQQSLRDHYPADLVRCALTLCELRKRGRDKFTRSDLMWFDRKGLEQSTPELVAQHKSIRFQQATTPIYDLCSGIGSDSIAIAAQGRQVISVDTAPAAGIRTLLNAQVYAVENQISTLQIDVRQLDLSRHWLHIDPDRRTQQRRAVRLEDYEPSLEFLQKLTETAPAGGIKLSPASNFGGKFRDCEIELISLNGECKEATVWFGEAASEYDWRATLLPSGTSISANPGDHYPRIQDLGAYLYDPDPAVVRAGLIDAVVDQLGLGRLDSAEEYLTSERLVSSPFVTPFRVLDELSHNPKEIRHYFRDHPVREVEIKCRHIPTNADQMRKKLPLTGTGRTTLIIARLQGKSRAIIAERVV